MTGSRAQRHLRALTRLRAGARWRGTGMNALQVLRDARDTRAAVAEFVVERRAPPGARRSGMVWSSGGGVWSVRLLGVEDGQYVAAEDRDAAGQYAHSAIIEVPGEHRRVAGASNDRLGEGDRHDVEEKPGGVHFVEPAAPRARR